MSQCRAGMFIKKSRSGHAFARRWRAHAGVVAALLYLLGVPQSPAVADEGGVSFWVPGFFGSLAATPQVPGWTVATMYYHTSVKAGGDVAFARQVSRGQITANFTGNSECESECSRRSRHRHSELRVCDARAGRAGRRGAAGAVRPQHGFRRRNADRRDRTDRLHRFRRPHGFRQRIWRSGTAGLAALEFRRPQLDDLHHRQHPGRRLRPERVSRISASAIRRSMAAAATPISIRPPGTNSPRCSASPTTSRTRHTQYQNGIDMHLDWGASQFLSKQTHIGLVGYAYQQLTCDSGAGNRVGCFQSRVFAIGPQIGHIIPLGTHQGYLNLKGYKEFGAEHRPEGWNVWLTFVISPAAPTPPTPSRPMITK